MRWGRWYFAAQSLGGAIWWIGVFLLPWVRTVTLGSLDPVPVAVLDIPFFVVGSALAAAGIRVAAVISTAWTLLVAIALAVFATVATEAGWGVLIMAAATGGSVVASSLLLLGRVPTEWIVTGPFGFRSASDRSPTVVHLATTFGQILVFWGLFLVVAPVAVAWLEGRWRLTLAFPVGVTIPLGAVVLVVASGLGLWSAVTMATRGRGTPLPSAMPNRLVVAGPYRFVRNPMAVAGIAQGVAVGLLLSSWLVIAYAVAGSVLWNFAVRPWEERDLEARFGDGFRRYRDAVRCWVPGAVRLADPSLDR